MTEVKRVMSIGAHSLDAELLGGPLMIKYAKTGAHVSCIHVTQGRLEDPNATEEQKKAYLEELLETNRKAAEDLGGDSRWLGYVSSSMPTEEVFADRLEKMFTEEKTDLVITHWRGSMHQRHIATYNAVTEAVKSMHRKGSNIKLVYGMTFEDLNAYVPQAYFVLTQQEVDQWFKALNEYRIFRGGVNDFPYQQYYPTNLKVKQIESGSDGPTVCYMYASVIENQLW
jgi:LmbE family N-acetylglucosaminyl deacetylase